MLVPTAFLKKWMLFLMMLTLSAPVFSEKPSTLTWVKLSDLPAEVTTTMWLIDQGGPFPYEKDGAVFGKLAS